jgi:Methyltransferase domain
MIVRHVARGLLTYVPPIERRIVKYTKGTDSARYCYSVWLRHLVMARTMGLPDNPRVVAELGPGDSLGIGIAALLAGASHYVGLDVVEHAHTQRNLVIFDELVALLRATRELAGPDEMPELKPYLSSYRFPKEILTSERLAKSLREPRIAAIRRAVEKIGEPAHVDGEEIRIDYRVPWYDPSVIQRESIDMVFSQAVLEHVDDLETTYAALAAWLKKGGVASHQIGFASHGITSEWNGHWTISEPVWKLIRGQRPYLLNREPVSTHVRMLRESGLEIVNEVRVHKPSDIMRTRLASRSRYFTEEDLTTKAIFLQAVKQPAWTTFRATGAR